jgi:hypothetical protein
MPRELRQFATVFFFGLAVFAWYSHVQDWIGFSVYLISVSCIPVLLYRPFIKSVDAHFPTWLFILAFFVKLSASALRYWTLVDIYSSMGDAIQYHEKGMEIASFLSSGDFSPLSQLKGGTSGLDLLTGIIYTLFPQNMEGAFVLFAALAFVGSIFFYRAFVIAFPDRPRALYRVLIFFLPSILFWPSSLGKDAIVFMGLGVAAYGMVLLLRKNSVRGLIWVSAGLAALLVVRPYTAGFFIFAAGTASIFVPDRTSRRSLGLWLVSGCLLVVIGFFVVQQSADFLKDSGMKEFSWQGVVDFYQSRKASSTGGGSRVLTPVVVTLLGPFYAIVTILFRPFPWEAHNPQSLIASLETLVWLTLIVKRRKLFLSRIRSALRDPFVAFIIIFSLTMIMVQTTTGNFAIIARQRVQFLPFFLMLLA